MYVYLVRLHLTNFKILNYSFQPLNSIESKSVSLTEVWFVDWKCLIFEAIETLSENISKDLFIELINFYLEPKSEWPQKLMNKFCYYVYMLDLATNFHQICTDWPVDPVVQELSRHKQIDRQTNHCKIVLDLTSFGASWTPGPGSQVRSFNDSATGPSNEKTLASHRINAM